MDQARIADLRPVEVKSADPCQPLQVFQPHIADLCSAEVKVFELCQSLEVYQTRITNLSDTEISLGPDSMLDPHVLIVAEVTPAKGVNRVSGAQQTAANATTQVFPIAHRYLLELQRGH